MSLPQGVPTIEIKASTPVEMGTLSSTTAQGGDSAASQSIHNPSEGYSIPVTESRVASSSASSEPHIAAQPRGSVGDMAPLTMPQPALLRTETEAIGPSTDLPTPLFAPSATAEPTIIINLLLTSTGTRHPYKIDERYLSKRGVSAQGETGQFDPFVISVYTLKELIWRDWREGVLFQLGFER